MGVSEEKEEEIKLCGWVKRFQAQQGNKYIIPTGGQNIKLSAGTTIGFQRKRWHDEKTVPTQEVGHYHKS